MIIQPIPVPLRSTDLSAPVEGAGAYAEMEPRFEAVTKEQEVAINLDFPTMATLLLSCHGRIMGLLPQAKVVFANFDPEPIEKMPIRAMALQQAHTLYLAATTPEGDDLGALQESGNALRVRLHTDAAYMVKRGFIDAKSIESVKFQPGYRTIATDLMVLCTAIRQGSSVAAGKVTVNEDDLTGATTIANRLFDAVALREKNSREVARTTRIRQQAYSFVFREYDTIRSIVSFLRWEQGDADDFAPSLFAGRRSSRRDKATPAAQDGQSAQGNGAQSNSGQSSAQGAASGASHGALTSGATVGGGSGQGAREPSVPVGHEGGSPFIS